MRADLADVRLAARVFAPHYAAPCNRTLTRDAVLHGAFRGGDELAQLAAQSRFELLDVTGSTAWGIAVDSGLVGYLDADALAGSGARAAAGTTA